MKDLINLNFINILDFDLFELFNLFVMYINSTLKKEFPNRFFQFFQISIYFRIL